MPPSTGRLTISLHPSYSAHMLVREGELLDVQEVGVAKQAIEVNGEGMGGQFGLEAGTEAPEAIGMVGFDMELAVQLAVDGLDDLAGAVEEAADGRRHLAVLVAAGEGEQPDAPLVPQVVRHPLADVALVADGVEVGVLGQQFLADGEVTGVGGGGNGAKRRGRSPGSGRQA